MVGKRKIWPNGHFWVGYYIEEMVVWARDCSLSSFCYWDGATVVFDDDFLILSSQIFDDSLVNNLMANLINRVVKAVADAECFPSCEEDIW